MASGESIEPYILQNFSFDRLPSSIRQALGNSEKQWDAAVLEYSLSHQLRWKKNLVRKVIVKGLQYYEQLLYYSRTHMMMFPYHLSDICVVELKTTPFTYYQEMLCDMIRSEKSYDSLPNFSAGDCLNCLGIGRNQYIDLINTSKSKSSFFARKKDPKLLLPTNPIGITNLAYWWTVTIGYVTEEDIKNCNDVEHALIDRLYDRGTTVVGVLDKQVIESLYKKNLIYFNVPIADDDKIFVPPLEGFVMNRVLGDYFENLLYKIFVTLDAHTAVKELATLLRQDLQLVKDAVSAYCRLGYAVKLGTETLPAKGEWHPSWRRYMAAQAATTAATASAASKDTRTKTPGRAGSDLEAIFMGLADADGRPTKRAAFVFDSTLTAFLMMGNLSPGLKKHAVTMFEAGKLSDESMDDFLAELDGSNALNEGEAQTYFEHAMVLRDTIRWLRRNPHLNLPDCDGKGLGLDLLRCESINSLDAATCSRVLQKNYAMLVTMAPLARETRSIISCSPPHMGPSIPEITSTWFKLWLYSKLKGGPPSLLLVTGTRLTSVPEILVAYDEVIITSNSNETHTVSTAALLMTLNDMLCHSPVLVQGYSRQSGASTFHLPFPLPSSFIDLSLSDRDDTVLTTIIEPHEKTDLTVSPNTSFDDEISLAADTDLTTSTPRKILAAPADLLDVTEDNGSATPQVSAASTAAAGLDSEWTDTCKAVCKLDIVRKAFLEFDLNHRCGFITLVRDSRSGTSTCDWTLFNINFGMPLFDRRVNTILQSEITRRQLFRPENLRRLTCLQRKEALEVLSFIGDNQELPLEIDPLLAPNKHITLSPSYSLIYNDGISRLCT